MTHRTRLYRMNKVIKLMRQYDKSFNMSRYFMNLANTDIEIGIKALRTAIKLQGKRDNAK